MEYQYKRRDEKTLEKRASQSGSDYQGIYVEDVEVYTTRKGENSIRILPPTWDDASHYGIDVWVHNQVGPGNATVLCLTKMKNKTCSICEEVAKLSSRGNEEEAKELKAKKRVLIYLIDRKDEEKGPQVWAMPWGVDQDIAKLSKDKDTGEVYWVDDPNEGYDLHFDREGEKILTKYVGVVLARRPSKVAKKHITAITDFPLPEVLRWRTSKEILDLYTGGSRDEEEVRRPSRARDEEEPPPRRRARNDDLDGDGIPESWPERKPKVEEEEPPRRRAAAPVEEDEAPPSRRRAAAPVEEDEAPPPRRRIQDEEEPPPRPALRDRLSARDRER